MRVDLCRLCKTGTLSEPKLVFPPTPLANEFLREPKEQDVFPLEVAACNSCGHYQLNEGIDPERLFSTYSYAAGHSVANVTHFRDSAIHLAKRFGLMPQSRVLDIASNDGTLLQAFKDQGMEILGIDPAENIGAEANEKGIPTIIGFFTAERAERLKEEHGTFDLVTANNVFAHVPDLEDFAKGVKTMLAPEGVFSFEVSYFVDVCDNTVFDTIYHEHSSYHTLAPLLPFFKNLGMEVFDVEHLPNHGGSVRVYVRHAGASIESSEPGQLAELLEEERGIEDKVARLAEKIAELREKVVEKVRKLKEQGVSIAVYGAPAKATTLMYTFGLDGSVIDFVIEDAPLKQGTYTPGTHIPILTSQALVDRTPGAILVLAWNFADTIIAKYPDYKGIWIVPLPEFKMHTP